MDFEKSEETSQASSEKENDSKSDKKYESESRSKPVSSSSVEMSKKQRRRVVMELDDPFFTYGRQRPSG